MDAPFQFNRLPTTDAWGRPKAVIDHSLFHAIFTYDVPPTLFKIKHDGTEVATSTKATSSGGMLKMDCSGLTSVSVTSYRHPRYQPNRGILYSASWILPSFDSDAVLDFGVYNDGESGIYFRATGGKVYACRRSLGVEAVEEITLPAGADLTKGSLYDIQAQWRGIGSFFFYITHNKGTTVHAMQLLGTRNAITVDNPALSISQTLTRGTVDAIAYCGCIDYTSEGGDAASLQYGSAIATNINANAGTGIIAIRQPATIGGRVNSRDMRLARITIQADKKAEYSLYVSRQSGAVTATSWAAIGGGSYIEKATGITATSTTGARYVSSFSVAAGAQVERTNPVPTQIDFFLTAGDVLFVVCDSGAGAVTDALVEWGEET